MESSTVSGIKLKPCTKFFRFEICLGSFCCLLPVNRCVKNSTSGCQFGDGCHFLHYVSGGHNAVSGITAGKQPSSLGPAMAGRNAPSLTAVKNKLCNRYNTAEGCKFGERCHFAHGEWELAKSAFPAPPATADGTVQSFGVSCTSKISVDDSLVGAIIGRGGSNSKHICRMTGARLSIRDHESDLKLKNIELEGTLEQIRHAGEMVEVMILSIGSVGGSGNRKTKMCEYYAEGSCTFADRCHFAHGACELRNRANE